MSLMEAMAAGLPCVASRVRGSSDLLADGRGGALCLPTDVAGLAEGLRSILGDPALAAAMGARNRETVAAYALPEVRAHMAALYNAQLAKGEAH